MNNIILLLGDNCDSLMVSIGDERDINGMITINQASADWLVGRIDTGTYFDVLAQFEIDPFQHISPVEDLIFNQVIALDF